MDEVSEVRLVGRLATPPEVRVFDSGAVMVRYLVTIRHEAPRRRVDVIPVVLWPAEHGEEAPDVEGLDQGSSVEVRGSVQRRFWEAPDGRRSRVEVVASSVQRVRGGADMTGKLIDCDVYLPVCVSIRGGVIEGAVIDFEGSPFSDDGATVWAIEGDGDWVSSRDYPGEEGRAVDWLGDQLREEVPS